ncbi:cytochrome P450 [Collybia nuda]|uniref:Cytochrome P450 n=1 Tax=Collybia nuda TaxID=64659 RepID=A0A9P5Y723_9AGAR|nr:cytochrome P450 [Collybia nuda]
MPYLSVHDINNLLKLLALAIVFKYFHRLYYRSKYWPPGPRGLPILGNIFQLPSFPWFKFTEWKAQYGPIISLNLAGQPMIILNTAKAASDLLNHRSQIYSDRPPYIMAQEILTGGVDIALIPYGDLWRRMRRATHESFNIRASEKYMLGKKSAASTVLGGVYGWDPVGINGDPVIDKINNLAHRLVYASLPGAYLVEIFPIMKYLPSWIAKWKREGLDWFAKDTKMFEDLMSEVKERKGRFGFSNKELCWLAGAMFLAGSETTAAATAVFLLAMVLNPDVMREAQAELDEVIGRDRPPTFRDFDRLPYIQAVVKEVFQDVQERAIHRDPEIFPDPDEFRPSRFLDASGKLNHKLADNMPLGHVAFGFGRRMSFYVKLILEQYIYGASSTSNQVGLDFPQLGSTSGVPKLV